MPDSETQGLLNKDLQQLASAKHFLGNFNHFKQKAKNLILAFQNQIALLYNPISIFIEPFNY